MIHECPKDITTDHAAAPMMAENADEHASAQQPGPPDDAELAGMEIPVAAGAHRDALVDILSRIPPHWGRWIDCEEGWFPLIVELHQQLLELDPHYVVRQVKEKYGSLRYYAGSSIVDSVAQERFSALLDIAERFSKTVCEVCGNSARLSVSNDPDPWYKTICTTCADNVAANTGRVFRPYVAPPR